MGLAVLAGVGAVSVGPGAPSASAYQEGCHTAPLIAHRGVRSGGATENTLGAIREATVRGAGFEVDLRSTADGRIVLMHDKGVARTTNGHGQVASMTMRQVRALRTDDGEQVPTLSDALAVLRDTPSVTAVLDVKALNAMTQPKLVRLVHSYGVADRIGLISFDGRLLSLAQYGLPEVPGFLILSRNAGLPSVDQLRAPGGPVRGFNVLGELVTPQWAAAMTAAGVPFNVRNTDDAALWDAALAAGSSWVMTDDVDAYHAYCTAPVTPPAEEPTDPPTDPADPVEPPPTTP